MKKRLGLSKPVTDEELEAWQPLVYDSCTLCGRCSLVCPVGNDIVYMVRKFREGMAASGHTPEGLRAATKRTVELGGPMGLKWETIAKVIGKAEEASGVPIPIDVSVRFHHYVRNDSVLVDFAAVLFRIFRNNLENQCLTGLLDYEFPYGSS